MKTLSVVISAYNEEKRIAKTLDSAKFADEIIVIDNSSIDKTPIIAKKYTKKVYTRPNYAMLNTNKNFGFTKANGDWILSLDADEIIPRDLAQEIIVAINQSSDINGYWIPRKNIIFGKWIQHSLWCPDYQLRLFRKDKGIFPEKHVHEMLVVSGKTEKLQHSLQHDNYSSVSQYLYKLEHIYTESEVENFIKSGKKINWSDALRFPLQDFLKTFFAQKGYLDGLHGLVLSLLQAFYAEIVFVKIWERQGFPEHNDTNFIAHVYDEVHKLSKEVNYWFYTSFIDESKRRLTKLRYRIMRKFV